MLEYEAHGCSPVARELAPAQAPKLRAGNGDGSRLNRVEATDEAQQRALPRSRRAHDRDMRTGVQVEVEPAQDVPVAKAVMEAADRDPSATCLGQRRARTRVTSTS